MTNYETSQLTTGIPAPADLLGFVKVGDHSTPPAGAGGSNQKTTFADALIPLQATGTASVDTANVQAAIALGQPLAPGNFSINATLVLDTNQILAGSGPGTVLTAAGGFSGSWMVTVKTPASSVQVTVRDLQLVPSTGSVGGIWLDNTGLGSGDPQHQIRNVYVNDSAGDAFKFGANIRSCVITGCQQYGSLGYGFNIQSGCTDNFFSSCLSGPSANHGFYVNDSNNMFNSCKSFFAGFNAGTSSWGTTQAGFYVNGTVCNSFTSCQAQQSALHGFDLQGCVQVTVTGCDSDSNSAGTTGGVGINCNGVTNSVVSNNVGYNNTGLTPQAQLYGVQVNGTQTGLLLFGNTVTGSSGPFNYAGGFGFMVVDENQADFSQAAFFKIPSPVLAADSLQTLTSSSTIKTATEGTYAAIPITMAGNVTAIVLEVPRQAWMRVDIINQSAFTATMAASGTSHVIDGTSAVIPAQGVKSFIYNGNLSLWQHN